MTISDKACKLILALCSEAGDDMTNTDEVVQGFATNHRLEDIESAAAGDVAALVKLRYDCGLPFLR